MGSDGVVRVVRLGRLVWAVTALRVVRVVRVVRGFKVCQGPEGGEGGRITARMVMIIEVGNILTPVRVPQHMIASCRNALQQQLCMC